MAKGWVWIQILSLEKGSLDGGRIIVGRWHVGVLLVRDATCFLRGQDWFVHAGLLQLRQSVALFLFVEL